MYVRTRMLVLLCAVYGIEVMSFHLHSAKESFVSPIADLLLWCIIVLTSFSSASTSTVGNVEARLSFW